MTLAYSKDGLNPMSFGDSNLNPMMERLRYQRASGRSFLVIKIYFSFL